MRPYGVVVGGTLQLGYELVLDGQRIVELRPHTGLPEPFVVSPAFVNAHSHLEYRGLLGRVPAEGYWPWIRELTRQKREQNLGDVRSDTELAARENRATGVALIGEHSDRPFVGKAMELAGIGGVIFQELITFFERSGPEEKWTQVHANAVANRGAALVFVSPHAYQTVDRESLRTIANSGDPFSIHVAETPFESELAEKGEGPIADFYREAGFDVPMSGKSIVPTLDDLGLVRPGAQFVHCCDVGLADIELMAARGVSVAHCPRSNEALGCPRAPVRAMLEAGLLVGLGLDSAASSGPIDMFAEMRAALAVSEGALLPEQVWTMATSMGAASLPIPTTDWEIRPGSSVPLVKLHLESAQTVEDIIVLGSPDRVEWVTVGAPV